MARLAGVTGVGGVVLAGGQALRMGGVQKSLLEIDGTSLMARCLDRLGGQVDALAINANADLDSYRGFGCDVIPDANRNFDGPLAGVLAGMVWAQGKGLSHIATVAGDTPFFPHTLVADLMAATTPDAPIAMAATPDPERGPMRQPTFALWPVALGDDLAAGLETGLRKIVLWAERHGVATHLYPVTPYDPFFNVNAPDDMDVARGIAAEFDK